MKSSAIQWMSLLASLLRQAGPYLLIEIVMPGGTLLALLLFIYQHRRRMRDEYDGLEPLAMSPVR